MEYPKLLKPDHQETFELNGRSYTLPGVTLKLIGWTGTPIINTFGGKPVVNCGGKPMFAELAIQRMATTDGWSARWVETYGARADYPFYFTDWVDGPLAAQKVQRINEDMQVVLLAKIRANNHNSYAGIWDVLAWRNEQTLFIESKRIKKDKIRDTQLNWVEAGLASGLKPDNFLIVQWDF